MALSSARAVALMIAMALQLSAAVAAAPPPARALIGKAGCDTTCGNVSVPYPFGFGPSHCYWEGLNLTCDTSDSDNPRLLLGDRQLLVTEISLANQTVRVMGPGSIINTTGGLTSAGWNTSLDLGRGLSKHGYLLSARNELVVTECNVMATIWADIFEKQKPRIVGGCASFCASANSGNVTSIMGYSMEGDKYCSGRMGCCVAPLACSGVPVRIQATWLQTDNHTGDQLFSPGIVFVAERGWVDNEHRTDGLKDAPLVLDFAVTLGLPPPRRQQSSCSQDVQRMLCKSGNSNCFPSYPGPGYACKCNDGYDGNPYLADGCQDIDECMIPEKRNSCLGGYYCHNLPGGYECRHIKGFSTGLIIGLSVASVPVLLLVPGILFLLRKFKQRRIKVQKQKYFKQNRGQLLQQLVSQKADIAERMIIPWDELAKATNNFDKAREIGGGGHGTVYKGILSDLHVVAIKKSKITIKKEIDEFINEVAILSQINHKNVVKLFGCCLETEVPLLVYEFIPNGTLYHHLHIEGQERSLSWSDRLRIATEIATSLAYLHSSVSITIIHRDIKSSNILLDDTMTSKISDFGASRYIPIDNTGLTTRIQGTFGYLDPECLHTGRLTEKSDVYSFGVILVELLTRKKPTCSQLSNEYGGLVPHFLNLLASRNLVQILDPQVLEEGGREVHQVIMLATSCINLRGEERPTMRQVEHTLQGLQQGPNDGMVTEEFEIGNIGENYPSWTSEGQRFEESSRRYSLEQEMMMSARYPR